MMQLEIRILEKLSNAFGPPGFEEEVVEVLKEAAQGAFPLRVDAMMNTYMSLPSNTGGRPLVMLDAHLDEVGCMVHSIDEKGLIRFVNLGGWVTVNLPAHAMEIRNSRGEKVPAVVVSKPPHFMSAAERANPLPEMEALRMDVGATSHREVVEVFGIEPGNPIVPAVRFAPVPHGGVFSGKAFDNRVGCFAVLETMRRLKELPLEVDVVAAFAAQEEVGMRGARVTTQVVRPDLAIVFEGSPADDGFAGPTEAQGVLGQGVQIRHLDQSYVSHPGFIALARENAKAQDILVQHAVRRGGSTNAGQIHIGVEAVPVLVLGVPSRYVHTHHGFCAEKDIQAAIGLATATVASLTGEKVDKLQNKHL